MFLAAIPIVEENTHVSDIEYSPLVGGFGITLNDGRAAFLTATTLKFDPNVRYYTIHDIIWLVILYFLFWCSFFLCFSIFLTNTNWHKLWTAPLETVRLCVWTRFKPNFYKSVFWITYTIVGVFHTPLHLILTTSAIMNLWHLNTNDNKMIVMLEQLIKPDSFTSKPMICDITDMFNSSNDCCGIHACFIYLFIL